MLVASLIATAIWCFALSLQAGEQPNANWMRAGFVACALAVLTKGLIGFALPGLVMGIWVIATRRWHQLPKLPWLSGLGLFVLVAAPWFVLAGWRYPELWSYMFGNQQFTRFTGTGFNNQQPWWFYLAALLVLLFPWPLFVFWRRRRGAESSTDTMTKQTLLLCCIWLMAILVFFTIPRSKLIGYILPVMPPLALLAAVGWERAMAHRQYASRVFVTVVVAMLLVSSAFTVYYATYQRSNQSNGTVANALACRAAPGETIYVQARFPYDLPFIAQTTQPLAMVQDWPQLRGNVGDNWQRELMDAGDFEPARAAQILVTRDALAEAATQPRRWLLTPAPQKTDNPTPPSGWRPVYTDTRWVLWQSAPETLPVPVHLDGCQQ
jgi:hypothetical protein